jgi:hypothetical protein
MGNCNETPKPVPKPVPKLSSYFEQHELNQDICICNKLIKYEIYKAYSSSSECSINTMFIEKSLNNFVRRDKSDTYYIHDGRYFNNFKERIKNDFIEYNLDLSDPRVKVSENFTQQDLANIGLIKKSHVSINGVTTYENVFKKKEPELPMYSDIQPSAPEKNE